MTTHSGRCFCGEVRYVAEGPELYACNCHCESCRRASGGAYVPWATFHKDRFRVVSGILAEYRSTPGVTRGHCSQCGTALTYEHVDRAGQIDITLASLDDPSDIRLRSHIWVDDKPDWVVLHDGLPQFPQKAG